MVYIDKNGRVLSRQPWDLNRMIGIFATFWFLVMSFFSSLTAPFRAENRRRSSTNGQVGWGSGGSGSGGGGGSGRGYGSSDVPSRRIGRITNSMDCNIPGGGCCGGGCPQ